ncbi:hypothetical protein BX600DRAFT_210999 [Xylariales sp. PMI_506]|nr:hypothetical protein BX600DRAFT_210999 [Xylariales sp. PMI_506]
MGIETRSFASTSSGAEVLSGDRAPPNKNDLDPDYRLHRIAKPGPLLLRLCVINLYHYSYTHLRYHSSHISAALSIKMSTSAIFSPGPYHILSYGTLLGTTVFHVSIL